MSSESKQIHQKAGFSARLFSSNIDVTLLLLSFFLLSLIIDDNKLLYYTCLVITIFYFSVLESSEWQATFGKRYRRLRVVDKFGERLHYVIALLRIVLKFLSLFLLPLSIGLIYLREDRRSLHDLILGTQVEED